MGGLRAWPKVLGLTVGIIPVLVLAGIAIAIILRSLPVLVHVGPGTLFGNTFSSQYGTGENIFGFLPAIWGTLTVTVIALAIALPVSMALALISTDFSLGIVGRGIGLLLGLFSGIPSIVYALASVIFVTSFMIPKFAGNADSLSTFNPANIGVTGNWPPSGVPFDAGALPWGLGTDPNSTLLGGFLVALFVIPFLAPMIEDALRSVPSAQREASLALGTTRWHTLRRVTLPYASPGLISAIALAALKAMGDVIIVIFVIGYEAPSLPTPLVDVFQRNPPLAAVGANLLGGIAGQGSCASRTGGVVAQLQGAQYTCSAAYFSGFLLLVVAFAVLMTAFFLQSRFRKRFAR